MKKRKGVIIAIIVGLICFIILMGISIMFFCSNENIDSGESKETSSITIQYNFNKLEKEKTQYSITSIDINPVQNPYVNGNNVSPKSGTEYLDRKKLKKV